MSSPTEGYSQSEIDAIVHEYEERKKEKERKLNDQKNLYDAESRMWDKYEKREKDRKQEGQKYLDDELNKRNDINSPEYKKYLMFYNSHLDEQKGVVDPIVPTYDEYSDYNNAIFFDRNHGTISHPLIDYDPRKEIQKFNTKFYGEHYQAKRSQASMQREKAQKLAQEQQEQKELKELEARKLEEKKKTKGWFSWRGGSKKRKTKSRNKKRKSKTRKYK